MEENTPSECQCSICHSIPQKPSCCGHAFCYSCVGAQTVCPLCRDNLNKLLESKTCCPNLDKGCEWTGKLRAVDQHLHGTDSPSIIPTDSPTSSPTDSSTSSPSPTSNPTDSPSPGLTNSPSPTSDSPSPSPGPGPTDSPSPSPGAIPTDSPSPTPCPTPNPTSSPTDRCVTTCKDCNKLPYGELHQHRDGVCDNRVVACVAGCDFRAPKTKMPQHLQEHMPQHPALISHLLATMKEQERKYRTTTTRPVMWCLLTVGVMLAVLMMLAVLVMLTNMQSELEKLAREGLALRRDLNEGLNTLNKNAAAMNERIDALELEVACIKSVSFLMAIIRESVENFIQSYSPWAYSTPTPPSATQLE